VAVGTRWRKIRRVLADDGDVAKPVSPARLRTLRGVAVLVLAALAAGFGAAGVWPEPVGAEEAVVIDDPRLDPSLAGVQVDGDGYRKALAAYRSAAQHLADAEARLARATEETDGLATERERLTAEIDEARVRGADARQALEQHRTSLRAVAVASYVQGRDTAAETLLGGAEEAATLARQDAMIDDVAERRTQQVREAQATIDETDGTIARDTDALTGVEERLAEATSVRDQVDAEAQGLRASTAGARRNLADWRLSADIAGSDLPLVALDAYVKAAARMAFERPECGIRWWGLAGIGKVESGHGTYGGARLGADGRTSQPIVGIPLDGSNGTAVVADTDGGELDGDPNTDRAVGPMQFIPGSWRSLGRDGNGDGRADPSNIYDAALAAAGLLCRAAGSGLDTDSGLYRAALGYNNSASYASLVVRTAKAYAAREAELIPPPPPTTTTTEAPASVPAPGTPVAPVATVPAIPAIPVVPPGAAQP
jgi:membrane-bound lytic murein transglycosylase B